MSGLLDDLTEPPRARKGVAAIMLALPYAEGARVEELLRDPQVSATWLAKVLGAHGFPVDPATLNKWRVKNNV